MSDTSVVVDLRSDTVTRPSPEMRRAIAEAEVGDSVMGDDPTVNELERVVAELLGKERAMYFPSGIMANQAAMLVHAAPGTEAVIDAQGHILNYEESAAAVLGGIQLLPVPSATGLLTAEDVASAIRPKSSYVPQTSLICLENTHNSAGGRILPLEQMREIAEVAREHGLPIHLDGARLANASVAAGVPMRAWADLTDTVMICLSKGLGAPVGSMLAGPEELIEKAWRVRRRLGGAMRQAGLLAAGGLYALRNNFERLAEDHHHAQRLAEVANGLPGLAAPRPDTNIVMIHLEDERLDPVEVLAELAERGVLLTQFGARRLRAVTHMDVDEEGIARAEAALAEVVYERAPAGV